MGLFFVYAVKASVCLAGFYLFYRLLLSKETFHRFNRVAYSFDRGYYSGSVGSESIFSVFGGNVVDGRP